MLYNNGGECCLLIKINGKTVGTKIEFENVLCPTTILGKAFVAFPSSQWDRQKIYFDGQHSQPKTDYPMKIFKSHFISRKKGK